MHPDCSSLGRRFGLGAASSSLPPSFYYLLPPGYFLPVAADSSALFLPALQL